MSINQLDEVMAPIVFLTKSATFGHVSIPSRDLSSHFGPTSTAQRLRLIGVRARELFGDQFNPAMGLDFLRAVGTTLSN